MAATTPTRLRVFDRTQRAFDDLFGAARGRPAPVHPLFCEWDYESLASRRMERRVRAALRRGEYQSTLDALRAGIAAYGVKGAPVPSPLTATGQVAVYAARTITALGPTLTGPVCERLHETVLALLRDLGASPSSKPGGVAATLKTMEHDIRRRAHLHLERKLLLPALIERRVLASELNAMVFASWLSAVRATVNRDFLMGLRMSGFASNSPWLEAATALPTADFDEAIDEWLAIWRAGGQPRKALRGRLADAVLTRLGRTSAGSS